MNDHITPQFSQSYFLSQGEYTDVDNLLILQDDVNELQLKATRNNMDDLIFDEGLDFMVGKVFIFIEKSSQLPEPPYHYTVYPEKNMQAAIDQARTNAIQKQHEHYRFQTKLFSDHILADLVLNEDKTFQYTFLQYPLLQGEWIQENKLFILKTKTGTTFYGSVSNLNGAFNSMQLPGMISGMTDNTLLHTVTE